jgi:hypothetical protein
VKHISNRSGRKPGGGAGGAGSSGQAGMFFGYGGLHIRSVAGWGFRQARCWLWLATFGQQ